MICIASFCAAQVLFFGVWAGVRRGVWFVCAGFLAVCGIFLWFSMVVLRGLGVRIARRVGQNRQQNRTRRVYDVCVVVWLVWLFAGVGTKQSNAQESMGRGVEREDGSVVWLARCVFVRCSLCVRALFYEIRPLCDRKVGAAGCGCPKTGCLQRSTQPLRSHISWISYELAAWAVGRRSDDCEKRSPCGF